MMRCITLFFMIFISAFVMLAAAQDLDASSFEAFIEEAMEASNIPGLAVVMFDEDGTAYEKAFGIADPENRAVTLDTPFQLGSVSKSFAALVIVQLAAEGRVELDTPIIEYLPYFRTRGPDGWQDITLRHVLSHRSGFVTLDGNRNQEGNYRGADALGVAVSDLKRAKLGALPGTTFEYSNANYMIAAAVIEAVTGQSYEAAMQARIFTPLGMTNSYVQVPMTDSVEGAIGFRQWFGMSKAFPNLAGRAYVAAGGVVASARDLAVYVKAIAAKDPRIVPPEFADELLTRQGDDPFIDGQWGYGLGWMINDIEGQTAVYHSGLNGGFVAEAGFIMGAGRGGVVLVNQSGILQADVPGAVLRKGLGLDPGPSRPSAGSYFLIWSMAATVVVLLFSFIFSTVRFNAYVRRNERVNILRRAVPSFMLFGLGFALIKIIPNSQAITLSGLKIFVPDLWLCFTLSAAIAIIWGLTRLIFPLKIKTRT